MYWMAFGWGLREVKDLKVWFFAPIPEVVNGGVYEASNVELRILATTSTV
ncbi:hypothetical protein AXFE_13770 [Acidithrix ferrooxidans]|uniref:Uncharacterized protein n=1 Tax=Acidithrix ferrooxidans TaxID=1280514 RepID=A0A0D8HKZ1_9ACTN|nr:hypothetical protein AXFE_13770 [Acidithrix ferrooxidans]CAG4922325.1 unnamed protein product [Acidithrix sp. C25]